MKNKLFSILKKIYKRLPVGYKTKNKLKGLFYRLFGFAFKNTTSYRVWNSMNTHAMRNDIVKVDKTIASKYYCDYKIAIQLHLYYVDLLEEFITYFNNIPYCFDVMVSMVNRDKLDIVENELSRVKNIKNVYIELVENRGRDVAPLVSVFGKKILEYDYICHIHSKKSLFTGSEQSEWRRHLLNGLMGNEEIVRENMYLMEKGEKVGLIYPETFSKMSYQGHTWLKNKIVRDELLARIGVNVKSDDIYIDYPMGTMFWAKVEAIKQFFQADIRMQEFPKEEGQNDGTIAHAFERCLGIVCRYNGYNMLIFDAKDKTYAYNYGWKNMNQYLIKSYDHMKLEMSSYDVVSFDIFDTLISRKISQPEAILKAIELKVDEHYGEQSNFAEKRKAAEINIRNKYPTEDCDIDDIYAELRKISGWSMEKSDNIKAMELEIEYCFIEPKLNLIDVLKYVKHNLKKEVYLISDMHLRRNDIERMLNKCGINKEDYDDMLLSSELNIRKDNGTMWKYFMDRHKDSRCIHIGDNEVSDVQIPGDFNVFNYHVMSNKALFQLSDIGKAIGNIPDIRASDAVEQGLFLNRLFSEPFRFNESKFNVKIKDAQEFGYSIVGPIVLNYILWLMKEAFDAGSKKILFFAREGYIFKQVFDVVKHYSEINEISGDYLYVSRRALSFASIEEEKDIEEPLNIYYEGKLNNLLKERFGIMAENVPDEDIKLPDNKSKVLKYINKYKKDILLQAKSDRENYIKYMDKVMSGISSGDSVIVSDIGYSGTIQYYLSGIAKRGFDGRYMATDDKKKPLLLKGNTIKGYYIDGDSEQEISKSNIHKYHLLMESILIAPEGQLVCIDENGQPLFENKENMLYDNNITEIHRGILMYAKDYTDIMSEIILKELPEKNLPEQMIYSVIKTDILDKSIADSMRVDDKYCSGEIKNAIDFYRKRN